MAIKLLSTIELCSINRFQYGASLLVTIFLLMYPALYSSLVSPLTLLGCQHLSIAPCWSWCLLPLGLGVILADHGAVGRHWCGGQGNRGGAGGNRSSWGSQCGTRGSRVTLIWSPESLHHGGHTNSFLYNNNNDVLTYVLTNNNHINYE